MANNVNILDLIRAAQSGMASHSDILSAREGASPEMQKLLAPLEHRAFAREFAQESPLKAAVSLPFAIPAYTASKAIGASKARSPASVEEMKQGYIGLLEGLLSKFRGGEGGAGPTPSNETPENTKYDLTNPDDFREMMKRVSPEYNTPTKQLGDSTPYGPGAYAKMIRRGKEDPRLTRSLAEEVAKTRKEAGLPSAKEILDLIYANNPKLAQMQKKR